MIAIMARTVGDPLKEPSLETALRPRLQALSNEGNPQNDARWLMRGYDARVREMRMSASHEWRRTFHLTSTFLNCHGSDVSISSGNNPGLSESGVQSV